MRISYRLHNASFIKTKLSLKQLSDTFFTTKKTDDTAMEVGLEQPVSPQVLQDLISTKVSAATKKLTNEINKLKKLLDNSLVNLSFFKGRRGHWRPGCPFL